MGPADFAAGESLSFVLSFLSGSDQRILDVGCGNGLLASRLQANGHRVVAIDETPENAQAAVALGVPAKVARWPAFEENPFDAILFVASLHHIHALAEAVEQAHRLLVPSGIVIVEDFAWGDVDPVTAEWFYGVVCLLNACQILASVEGSFTTDLTQSGGEFACWQQSHDHELHTVPAMWSELERRFQVMSATSAPYLYRYLCPVLPQNGMGAAVVSEVFESERRLAHLGAIASIGRRFVGRSR